VSSLRAALAIFLRGIKKLDCLHVLYRINRLIYTRHAALALYHSWTCQPACHFKVVGLITYCTNSSMKLCNSDVCRHTLRPAHTDILGACFTNYLGTRPQPTITHEFVSLLDYQISRHEFAQKSHDQAIESWTSFIRPSSVVTNLDRNISYRYQYLRHVPL
jgi:hypothetical protein